MIYHILNGDSLAYSFPHAKIDGEVIVVREALMDGDLSGDSLHEFWQTRANYLGATETDYHNSVVTEFEKILNAPAHSTFNLWFEYDLFCQVNLWFVLFLLNSMRTEKVVFAVYTSYLDKTDKQFWNGFGSANAEDLRSCYSNRVVLSENDLQLGSNLWNAYKNGNLEQLTRFSKIQTSAFPYQQEVVNAHIERFPPDGSKGRPERVLKDIITNVSTDFHKVCQEFWNRESIYGFGDTQVKELYIKIMHRH